MTKTISLITVTFNSASTLKHTIDSIKMQTCSDFEYIIVDGASTDGTIEIILKNQQLISKWVSEPDKGIYDAINKGIAMSTGQYVGLIHADDMLASPDVLQSIVDAINEHHPDAIYGDLDYVSADDTAKVIRRWKSNPFRPELLAQGWMPPHPTLYVNRQLIDKISVYNDKMKISADYDFILRLFSQPGLRSEYLPKCLVKMRVGGASNRSIRNIVTKMKEDYSAITRNKTGNIFTLIKKNTGKIHQFFIRD